MKSANRTVSEDWSWPNAQLIRVTSRHFVAGMLVEDGIVVAAAPILKSYVGREFRKLLDEWPQRGWWCSEVTLNESHPIPEPKD